jgi:uncharacterized iron-regulated membrane protein
VVTGNVLHSALHRPKQLWLRRALFQVHLWAGLIVGLYIIVIGLSGSVLVFQDELEALGEPAVEAASPGRQMDILAVADIMRKSRPAAVLHTVLTPVPERPTFRGYVMEGNKLATIDAHPVTGEVLPASRWHGVVSWFENLHIFLLAGEAGFIANGVGAACLLLLSLTGILIWWPGVRRWKRALVVNFRANWKRINFDLHSVVGVWPLALISLWAVSGIYFAWPSLVTRAVGYISPVVSNREPKFEVKPDAAGGRADMRAVITKAAGMSPKATFAGIGLSNNPTEPIVVDMAREKPGDLLATDYIYFHPATGEHLATWRYGDNQTAGDWIIWLMHPLHFGTSWGLAVKVLWAALGLSLPLLTITGALMYWNRYLKRKFSGWS